MGQTINEESTISFSGLHVYEAESDYFTGLWVYHTPKAGVGKIVAFRDVVDPDRYGNDHRNVFDDLASKIVQKYGEPEDQFDDIKAGSKLSEPRDWLKGLRKKERVLQWMWELPQLTIAVEAHPLSVALSYQFSNFAACHREAEESILPEF